MPLLGKYLKLAIYQYFDPIKVVAMLIGSLSKSEQQLINESQLIIGKNLVFKQTPISIPKRFLQFIDELTFSENRITDTKLIFENFFKSLGQDPHKPLKLNVKILHESCILPVADAFVAFGHQFEIGELNLIGHNPVAYLTQRKKVYLSKNLLTLLYSARKIKIKDIVLDDRQGPPYGVPIQGLEMPTNESRVEHVELLNFQQETPIYDLFGPHLRTLKILKSRIHDDLYLKVNNQIEELVYSVNKANNYDQLMVEFLGCLRK